MFCEWRLCQLAAYVCSTRVEDSSEVLFYFRVVFLCCEFTILIPLKLMLGSPDEDGGMY